MRKLSDDVKIDRSNLLDEWAKNPGISEYWSEQWLKAWAEKDTAKIKLNAVMDDLELQIRTDPKAYGLKKDTDKAILNGVKTQPEYKEAIKNLHDKSVFYNRMNSAINEIDKRIKSLENITKLVLKSVYTCDDKPHHSLINEVRGYTPPIKRRNN